MVRKKTKTTAPVPSMSELIGQIESLGLEIHSWRNESQDGWWLPRLAVSCDGFILWEPNGTRNYPFPHYTVSWKHHSGGAYRELHNAVAWLNWAANGFQTTSRVA